MPEATKFELPPAPLLMLVTDRTRYGGRTLEEIFIAAIEGGTNMLQLREPELPARDLLRESERLRKLAVGGVPLLIFDRVDVALAAEADGVHLTAEGLPIPLARQWNRALLVGKTVSSLAEAVSAEMDGADFLVVEPVFSTPYLHGRTPVTPTLVRHIKSRVRAPLLASGGITAGNAHQVIAAGADGVAVTSEIVAADDPQRAARNLMDAMRQAWGTRPLLRDSLMP